jgi:Flp pilus assembly protein TadG
VAVEFVLIVPLLLLLLLVMVDFGRLMFVNLSLNSGAKEAVRALALGKLPAELDADFTNRVVTLGRNASHGAATMAQFGGTITPVWVCGSTSFTRDGTITTANCTAPVRCASAGSTTTLTLATRFRWLTPVQLIGSSAGFSDFNVSSKAVSLCLSA